MMQFIRICTLLLLGSGSVLATEPEGGYWAIAHPYGEFQVGANPNTGNAITLGPGYNTRSYGVGWNYPTKEAAQEAAVAECHKQQSELPCKWADWGRNECFAIIRVDVMKHLDPWMFPSTHYNLVTHVHFQKEPYRTVDEARAQAANLVATEDKREGRNARIEFARCSGTP